MYFNNFTKDRDKGYDNELQDIVMSYLLKNGSISGEDPFNGSPCRYVYVGDDMREGLESSATKSKTRQRCLVKGLSQYLFGAPNKSLADCCAIINRAGLSLYTAEGNSAIFDFLKNRIQPNLFHYSEYFGPQHTSGDKVGGMMHQDLQQLSFPDNSFDIVLTAEVMEHVPDAISAEEEIHRVLKPRGGYIFTLPYRPNALHDEVKAVMANGQVKHLMEPEFHGDPIRPGEGILVFRIFSEKGLKERFENMGASFNTYHMFDKSAGIINMDAFVHVVVKLSE